MIGKAREANSNKNMQMVHMQRIFCKKTFPAKEEREAKEAERKQASAPNKRAMFKKEKDMLSLCMCKQIFLCSASLRGSHTKSRGFSLLFMSLNDTNKYTAPLPHETFL